MRYVYVIMCGCIGDYSVHGVYSSEKKANSEIERMNKDKYEKQTRPWVEKWEVQ